MAELPKHSVAMECDNGVFKPLGFRFQGSAAGLEFAKAVGAVAGAAQVVSGEGEADVGPILQRGVPGLALDVDATKYFWYHHSSGDMMTVIDRKEFAQCVALMAAMAYLIADVDQAVPR